VARSLSCQCHSPSSSPLRPGEGSPGDASHIRHGAQPLAARTGSLTGRALERVPIKWNHLIDKDSLRINKLEHVLIEKVEQLFRDML
jgi:hypothetical protein